MCYDRCVPLPCVFPLLIHVLFANRCGKRFDNLKCHTALFSLLNFVYFDSPAHLESILPASECLTALELWGIYFL
jgi:hypothetical protein